MSVATRLMPHIAFWLTAAVAQLVLTSLIRFEQLVSSGLLGTFPGYGVALAPSRFGAGELIVVIVAGWLYQRRGKWWISSSLGAVVYLAIVLSVDGSTGRILGIESLLSALAVVGILVVSNYKWILRFRSRFVVIMPAAIATTLLFQNQTSWAVVGWIFVTVCVGILKGSRRKSLGLELLAGILVAAFSLLL